MQCIRVDEWSWSNFNSIFDFTIIGAENKISVNNRDELEHFHLAAH